MTDAPTTVEIRIGRDAVHCIHTKRSRRIKRSRLGCGVVRGHSVVTITTA